MNTPQVGTLDWLPARECPELLATPVRTALADSDLEAYVAAIDPDLADTVAFCAAYAVPLDASANCVVVAGRRGETATMIARYSWIVVGSGLRASKIILAGPDAARLPSAEVLSLAAG